MAKSSSNPSGSTDIGGTNIPNVFLKGQGKVPTPKGMKPKPSSTKMPKGKK